MYDKEFNQRDSKEEVKETIEEIKLRQSQCEHTWMNETEFYKFCPKCHKSETFFDNDNWVDDLL